MIALEVVRVYCVKEMRMRGSGRGQSDGAWTKVASVIQGGDSLVMVEGATYTDKDRGERKLW